MQVKRSPHRATANDIPEHDWLSGAQRVADDDEHVRGDRRHGGRDDVNQCWNRPASARDRKVDRQRDDAERHRNPRQRLNERD